MLDPRMQPLCDAIVDLVVADIVRGFETKNAVAPAKENDGVEVQDDGNYTPHSASAKNLRALR